MINDNSVTAEIMRLEDYLSEGLIKLLSEYGNVDVGVNIFNNSISIINMDTGYGFSMNFNLMSGDVHINNNPHMYDAFGDSRTKIMCEAVWGYVWHKSESMIGYR